MAITLNQDEILGFSVTISRWMIGMGFFWMVVAAAIDLPYSPAETASCE
jgi:hypothetical protein